MAPPRRVEPRAAERLFAGKLRHVWPVKLAHRRDHDIGLETFAVGEVHVPALLVVAVAHRRHLRTGADVFAEIEASDAVLQVREDLRLLCVETRPVGLRRERITIEVGGHVAGGTGVCVVTPRAADARVLLQHDEVVEARLAQPDAGADAGNAGADDHDARPIAWPRPFPHRFTPRLPMHRFCPHFACPALAYHGRRERGHIPGAPLSGTVMVSRTQTPGGDFAPSIYQTWKFVGAARSKGKIPRKLDDQFNPILATSGRNPRSTDVWGRGALTKGRLDVASGSEVDPERRQPAPEV